MSRRPGVHNIAKSFSSFPLALSRRFIYRRSLEKSLLQDLLSFFSSAAKSALLSQSTLTFSESYLKLETI